MQKLLHRPRLVLAVAIMAAGAAVAILSLVRAGSESLARVATSSPLASAAPSLLRLDDPFPTFPHPLPVGLDHRLGAIAWSAAGPYVDGRVLVAFRRGTPRPLQAALERRAGALPVRELGTGVLLSVRRTDVPRAIRRLKLDPAVRYAEPDYVMVANGLPNDPQFGLQWGLQNTGQTVNGTTGTANADEQAVPAWKVTTGSPSVVVAVADTGVEYTHPDLAANIWTNPGGLGGCAAGTHGFDVLSGENACDPMDTDTAYGGHGTHVAGIIGAVGNNGTGVTGVNWTTSILPVKWLDSNSSGSTSDLINALQKVIALKQAGVNIRVVNDSPTFVGTAFSQALSDEIDQLGANDILFVTPAGNTSQNNDTTPRYPCSYDRPSEICVAATDQSDKLPSWANWGANSVDLAAPGNNIYSTLRNASYGYINGSSMSAAEVSGAAALILSTGYQSATALKADILNNVDPDPALSGKVRTGGRLNICRAISGCTPGSSTPPPPSSAPVNNGAPTISGTAQVGQTLSASNGSWTGSPTAYSYQWERCDTSGNNCATIFGAASATYAVAKVDQGSTLKVAVTASNSIGPSTSLSSATGMVAAMVSSATFGTTTIGTSSGVAGGDYKRANMYSLSTNAVVSKLSVYLQPTSTSGTQTNKGFIYADSGGSPGALIAVTDPLTFTSSDAAGWYDMTFPNPPQLAPGNYWLGFISGPTNGVTGVRMNYTATRVYNANTYASGPSTPFGSSSSDNAQMSLYATYAVAPPAVPANTAAPAVSGNAQIGQTLSAGSGTWNGSPSSYAYQWERCNSSGSNCVPISGATSPSYTVGSADSGSTLEVAVTAFNAGGSGTAASAPTSLVAPLTPLNTAAPTISGTPQVGQTLSTSNGSWTGSPTSYAYQWQRCDSSGNNCTAITGATSQTYSVASGDLGSTLEATVTASNSAGSASSTTLPTTTVVPPPPANSAPPTVSGSAQVGQTLSTTTGTWTGSPNSYAYKWQRCDATGANCAAISGATSQTYTVVDADVGSTIDVIVTASNAGGSTSAGSAPTASVPAVAPTNTTAPTISGTPQVGQTLSVSNGAWSGTSAAYGYQWLRCDVNGNNCTAISSATSQTYTASTADLGSTLKATVTASNTAGSASATSTPTASVTEVPPANTAPPAISGTAASGQTLTTSKGSWSGSPTGYAYQWQRCNSSGNNCAAISGATSQTYTATTADIGSTVEATVTATNAAGTASATSAPTATIVDPPPTNITPPAISGTAQVGQTLTTSNGSWNGPPTAYAYQWQRCDSSGNNCTAISGATSQTYTVASADVGSTLVASVTASNSRGAATASSAATTTVPPVPPSNTAPPTVSGNAMSGQTLATNAGTWTGTAPSYSYQWERCASSCAAIAGATSQSYFVTTNDVGSTLEVAVTASNGAGSAVATSAPTATVQAAPPATLGTTTVGGNSDVAGANRKRVNKYTLSGSGSVTKLTMYLEPTSTSGSQALQGVIYADSGGAPGALIAGSNQLTYSSTQSAGWYDLTFPSPVHLSAGTYWIGFMSGAAYGVAGFRWTSVSGSRYINANTFTSGPTNPFGTGSNDSEEMSLYATYTPG